MAGDTLPFPITTQHITRAATPFCRLASSTVHGCRAAQEDDLVVLMPLNNHGICLLAVFDGHSGHQVPQYVRNQLPQALSHISRLPTWDGAGDACRRKNALDGIGSDHDDVCHGGNSAEDDVLFDEITTIFSLTDLATFATESPGGSTACVILAQLWDLALDQPFDLTPHQSQDSPGINGCTSSLPTHPNLVSLLLSPTNRDSIAIKLLSINVGDSMAMIIHRNNTFTLCSHDDTPKDSDEQKRILAAGGTVRGNRVNGNLAVSRAFGDGLYKQNCSLAPNEQMVIAQPRFQTHFMSVGDSLLVTSDGLFESEVMSPGVVAEIVRKQVNFQTAEAKLVLRESSGGEDRVGIHTATRRTKTKRSTPKSNASCPSSTKTGLTATQSLIESLWDPALVTRKLIQQSLSLNSHDNNSLIFMSFTPCIPPSLDHQQLNRLLSPESQGDNHESLEATQLAFISQQLHYLSALPTSESIPGFPYHVFPALQSFQGPFEADYDTQCTNPLPSQTMVADSLCTNNTQTNLTAHTRLLISQLVNNMTQPVILEDNLIDTLIQHQMLFPVLTNVLDHYYSVPPICLLPPDLITLPAEHPPKGATP